MKMNWTVLGIAVFWGISGMGQATSYFDNAPHSELFILGTFHFKDAGLDEYKPQYQIDMLSDTKQKEVQEVLDVLQKYKPTKIAVEVQKERQVWLDSLYTAYLEGRFQLKSNEIYQIGFRLGKMLQHKKLYAVDAPSRSYHDTLTAEAHSTKQAYFTQKWTSKEREIDSLMNEAFFKVYAQEDSLKTTTSLLDHLRYQNSEERLRLGHGHYLIGTFKMGEGQDYYGPDNSIWWYSRNSRIFHNLLQLQDRGRGRDRVLLLIGAGHVPILNFLAAASPDFAKRNLEEFLN
jgi:hypothetical protein